MTIADAKPIAHRTAQLGYARTESEITEELMIATGDTSLQVIVAEAECVLLELSSGRRPQRQAAHEFYQSLGMVDQVGEHARYLEVL